VKFHCLTLITIINHIKYINPCTSTHIPTTFPRTWQKIKEFEAMLGDSDEALQIDPSHFKVLYMKGWALLGLRKYTTTCEYLEDIMQGRLQRVGLWCALFGESTREKSLFLYCTNCTIWHSDKQNVLWCGGPCRVI
jgi:hypothetical protein